MSLELLVALSVAALTGGGVWLLLRRRSFSVVLGLALLSYAVNLFLFSMGRLTPGKAPILSKTAEGYTDPLPQALVLTAIVISFGMTALVVVLSLRAYLETGEDTVDARPDEEAPR